MGHKRTENKSLRFEARITTEQKNLFLRAAALTGQSLTNFIVATAYETAARTLREYEIMKLSERDREVFVNALLNPPEPVERLREAAWHYQRL